MRLFCGGAILSLFPFFLGRISLVAAFPPNSEVADGAANFPRGDRCGTPQIRREWRALSDDQKAEWISAVNVGSFLSESGAKFSNFEIFPTI